MSIKLAKLAYVLIQSIYVSTFYPFEVMGRGSETQLQVVKNVLFLI